MIKEKYFPIQIMLLGFVSVKDLIFILRNGKLSPQVKERMYSNKGFESFMFTSSIEYFMI